MSDPISSNQIMKALIEQSEKRELDTGSLEAQLLSLADVVVINSLDVSEAAINVASNGEFFSGEATAFVTLKSKDGYAVGEEVPVHFSGARGVTGQLTFSRLDADLTPFAQ